MIKNRNKLLSVLLICISVMTLISCGSSACVSGNLEKCGQNLKSYYLEKLDKIEAGMSDLDEQYAGNTYDMRMAANKEYKRWDDALNEIYSVLKTQISESEMKSLTQEEMQWIKDKEEKAEREAAQYEGGTIHPVFHITSLCQSTKDRCYELVNKYMQ